MARCIPYTRSSPAYPALSASPSTSSQKGAIQVTSGIIQMIYRFPLKVRFFQEILQGMHDAGLPGTGSAVDKDDFRTHELPF